MPIKKIVLIFALAIPTFVAIQYYVSSRTGIDLPHQENVKSEKEKPEKSSIAADVVVLNNTITANQSLLANPLDAEQYLKPSSAKKETTEDRTETEQLSTAEEIDDPEIAARQLLVDEWDEQYVPPEPTDENSIEWVDIPLAEEVNVAIEQECMENCADSLNELFLAEGDYADQVNPEDLRLQAVREGLIDPHEPVSIPLSEISTKPPPPTETGAYVTPE